LAFPEATPILVGNMVAHLRKCGVTTAFCGEHIRPFILRGSSRSYNHVQAAPGSPEEPGQIISHAAVSALAQQTIREPSSPSMASTPPTARPGSRARSLSAPPPPARGTSSTAAVGAEPGDEDVPMASTELGGPSLSETTEKAPDSQE
jgi:hypothetical protein